ncbi:alcohol dehydrogenase [Verticillium dahliae VdLs.17]|uniref:Alcohol dehydrogenase n=1 Tax=Verticillium dahliae (strain VdLs.17 / ATCC MYA-4575 / FGSC 10137) TaxID=498257 RepID=G2X4N4_VERDV|nr:alcohol dehydrogenase [Verticillium dahliae VdLs.17]EGY23678.1 alcohol dehydrogenase [Verticillium dahliae VdLs.17]
MSAPQTTKGWTVEGAVKPSVVPGSDGAGEVVAVGSKGTRFEKGAKVVTLFSQAHQSGELTPEILSSGLGGAVDGTLRQYGVFNEEGLSYMLKNLSYLEAGTLSCAALTAWNAPYGVRPFAKAAGVRAIATTSSPAKGEMLKKLGADHVINYKENPNWGSEAKAISGGVKHVIEVGGMSTMKESLNAVGLDGVVTIIGWIRTIEACDIKPVIDQKVLKLEELKEYWPQVHTTSTGLTQNSLHAQGSNISSSIDKISNI